MRFLSRARFIKVLIKKKTGPDEIKRQPVYRPTMRAMSAFLITTFLLWSVAPFQHLIAQPSYSLPVPQLGAPNFDSSQMQSHFDAAYGSVTEAEWQATVQSGMVLVQASWEEEVALLMDSAYDQAIGSLDHNFSEAEHDGLSYEQMMQEYVATELETQKQSAMENWEMQAEAAIRAERDQFLAKLATEQVDETGHDTIATADEVEDENLVAINEAAEVEEFDPNNIRNGYEEYVERMFDDAMMHVNIQEAVWERDWSERLNYGSYQYNLAMDTLDRDRAAFLHTLEQSDLQWQQNIQMMHNIEDSVRQSVMGIVQGIKTMILGSKDENGDWISEPAGMFYTDKSCDNSGGATCDTTDQEGSGSLGDLNQAGQDLLSRLESIEQNIDADDLTGFTESVITAMQDMQTYAEGRVDYWDGLDDGSHTFSQNDVSPSGSYVNAIKAYYDNNRDRSRLDATFGSFDQREIQGYYGVDACGSDDDPEYDYGHTCYSSDGGGAFQYHAKWEECKWWTFNLWCEDETEWRNEGAMNVSVSYTWIDRNAESNKNTWSAWAAQIGEQIAKWQEEILPSVTAWYEQVNTYEQNYAAWQVERARKEAEYETAYTEGRSYLEEKRDEFVTNMFGERRRAQQEFNKARSTIIDEHSDWQVELASLRDEGREIDDDLVNRLREKLGEVIGGIDIVRAEMPDVRGDLAAVMNNLPALEESFVRANEENLPDPNLILQVVEEFSAVANAMVNMAVSQTIEEQMEDQRQAMAENIAENLRAIKYEAVDENGNPLPEDEVLDPPPFTPYQVTVNADMSITAHRTIYSGTTARARRKSITAPR